MWANSSYRYSIPHWLTGWASNRAYVQWRSIADMPALWNSTETYTLVTTSYSRNINWEISIAKLWWKWCIVNDSITSEQWNTNHSQPNARSATFYLPATENVQRTASVGQRTANPVWTICAKDIYQYFQHVAPYMDFMKKRINESTGSCQHHESTKKTEV